ncbi:hypothetical protein RBG61_09360 [Paludicola sp. MB14-C6]|uniref:hypothetical protein n=1 Tax=Paludihabitans sp. MB14-C6 TaxID=3070656 RepID=UPI0027DBE568|nr:hypothetical protein [Paludicola sp. MB14-C6]WMJ22204.1 hypothetical protein RBG61_09360 [Paludicola sp. MB14-C6]
MRKSNKLFFYDLKYGIVKKIYRYIPIILITFFYLIYMKYTIQNSLMPDNPSWGDYLLWMFYGMEPYIPEERFIIPMAWLFMQVYIIMMVGNYAIHDLYGFGQQIMLRSKKRNYWWFSKCLYCVSTVLLYYIIINLIVFLYAIFSGAQLTLNTTQCVTCFMHSNDASLLSDNGWILSTFVLPVLTSCTFCFMQLALSFLIKPFYSYVAIIAIYIASLFYNTPLLIGNYSIIARNTVLKAGATSFGIASISNIVIMLICVIIGSIYIKKYNIIKSN